MTRALEAGATGFLSKPFVLAEVVLRVRLMLEETMSRSIQKAEPLFATVHLRGRSRQAH